MDKLLVLDKLLVCYTGGEGCCKVEVYEKESNGEIVVLHSPNVLLAKVMFNTINSLLLALGFMPGKGGKNNANGEFREWAKIVS